MGQVTIYLDDDVEMKMRVAAKSMNLSQSKWISNVIKEKILDEWPLHVKQLAGAWESFPDLNEVRNSQPPDLNRESF